MAEKERKISYYSKDVTRCPVCGCGFRREEMFSGRVNADDLTDELHRTYKPLKSFGEVFPLIYEIEVCPSCFFATFKNDFTSAGTKFTDAIREKMDMRMSEMKKIFGFIDYQSHRTLLDGAASYYLAIMCYDLVSADFAPTIKSGICSLRLSWLCNYLHQKEPTENWDYVSSIFYRKARFYYKHAVELEQTGKEIYSNQRNLGPDTDKNYGHEGVLYVNAILELKYGPRDDAEQRAKNLNYAKSSVARMFGFGKKNKSKPGPLLDKSKELYDRLKLELKDDSEEDE